jgi:hypothetical protein
MASYSDTRLVSIRDNLLAPTIFFESAPVSGYGDGIVTITLNVSCPQVGPYGELRGEAALWNEENYSDAEIRRRRPKNASASSISPTSRATWLKPIARAFFTWA